MEKMPDGEAASFCGRITDCLLAVAEDSWADTRRCGIDGLDRRSYYSELWIEHDAFTNRHTTTTMSTP